MAKQRVVKFDYRPTKEEMEAMSICNDNDCYIYPLPLNDAGSQYRVCVSRPGMKNPAFRLKTAPEVYDATKSEWCKRIFELYVLLKPNYEKAT